MLVLSVKNPGSRMVAKTVEIGYGEFMAFRKNLMNFFGDCYGQYFAELSHQYQEYLSFWRTFSNEDEDEFFKQWYKTLENAMKQFNFNTQTGNWIRDLNEFIWHSDCGGSLDHEVCKSIFTAINTALHLDETAKSGVRKSYSGEQIAEAIFCRDENGWASNLEQIMDIMELSAQMQSDLIFF